MMTDSPKLFDGLGSYPDSIDAFLDIDPYSLQLEPFIPSPAAETMDVACQLIPQNENPVTPFSPRGPPERNIFTGEFNFCVEVNSSDVQKKTFLYSHRLNRIYVDMKYNFSIQFNWDYMKAPHMFVRATVIFSDETQAEKRVECCRQHYHENIDSAVRREIGKNVLHSSRAIGTQGVFYCGDIETADSWYSVLVEFERKSPEPCSHAYQFVCKNSCGSGINRRATAIIFTLEDDSGHVFGRQKVGVRVCSCPRRDMLKDETEGDYKSGKKRIASNQIEPPKTKKIKVENLMDCDDRVYKLPPLQIVGSRATLSGLKVMLEMMELAMECRKNDPEAIGLYEQPIADLKETIKKMEKAKVPTQ